MAGHIEWIPSCRYCLSAVSHAIISLDNCIAVLPEANVIYGIVTNEDMRKAVKVSVIATGSERETEDKAAAPRLGPWAVTDARGRNGTGKVASRDGSADGHGLGVGEFVRRMWSARAAKR